MTHTITRPHRILVTLAAAAVVAATTSVWSASDAGAVPVDIDQLAPATVEPDWPQPDPDPDPAPNPGAAGVDDFAPCLLDNEGQNTCDQPTDEPTDEPTRPY